MDATAAAIRSVLARVTRMLTVAAGAFLIIAAIGRAQQPSTNEQPFTPQQGSSWCWAAAAQYVMDKADPGGDYSQRVQAETIVKGCDYAPRNTCKNVSPVFAGCNRPGLPTQTLDDLDFIYEEAPRALSWEVLQHELDAKRPVLFGWCVDKHCDLDLKTSMGHWMVAEKATSCDSTIRMVKVYNPAPCCIGQVLWIPYETYAQGAVGLKFWHNFYQVQPAGSAPLPTPTVTPTPAPTFDTGADAKTQAIAISKKCFPMVTDWKNSGLVRETNPTWVTEAKDGTPFVRRYLPLAELGKLVNKAELEKIPPVRVVNLKADRNHPLASVVLTEPSPHALIAIEDSEAARRQAARDAAAMPYGNPQNLVILETGLHFTLVDDRDGSQKVIVIASERDCRKAEPANVNLKPDIQEVHDFIEDLTVTHYRP